MSRPVMILLAVGLVLSSGAGPAAAATPAQKCAVAKNKAASKKAIAKLKCHQKALTLGIAVDPTCLTTAETKFDAAIGKADLAGGCVVTGDGAAIEAAVDNCVNAIVALTPVTTTTTTTTTTLPSFLCCDSPLGVCANLLPADQAQCATYGGTLAPAGDVCDPTSGNCGTARTGVSGCCAIGGNCVEGPGASPSNCAALSGVHTPDAACRLDGSCGPTEPACPGPYGSSCGTCGNGVCTYRFESEMGLAPLTELVCVSDVPASPCDGANDCASNGMCVSNIVNIVQVVTVCEPPCP